MSVCLSVVDCFVIVLLYDLALCNECSFSESWDEIPVKEGSVVTPQNSYFGM